VCHMHQAFSQRSVGVASEASHFSLFFLAMTSVVNTEEASLI